MPAGETDVRVLSPCLPQRCQPSRGVDIQSSGPDGQGSRSSEYLVNDLGGGKLGGVSKTKVPTLPWLFFPRGELNPKAPSADGEVQARDGDCS